MDALDVIGLAGSSTTYGAVRAGFTVIGRLALPGGFGNASVDGNRRALGAFEVQTAPPEKWEPYRHVAYVSGVPPCSGFSQLNTARNMAAKHGSRADNFRGVASPINDCQRALVRYAARCTGSDGKPGPEVVCFESVQGAYHQGLELMREFHALLKAETGQPYTLYHLLHSDTSLGGAQLRRRYFWVAARVPFGVDYERPRSVPTYEEVMGDLSGGSRSQWAESLADASITWNVSYESDCYRETLDALAPLWPAGASVSVPLRRYMESHGGALPGGAAQGWWKDGKLNMFESNVRRVAGDRRGCWVVPGGCEAKFVHWAEPRFLTVREFARLMSLPDSWSFDWAKSVGAAVNALAKACPVTTATWVARAAMKAVRGGKRRWESDPAFWRQTGEAEYVFDVTDEWKSALPEGYDPARHTQGAYASALAPARPSPNPSPNPSPRQVTRCGQDAPRALPEWGGGPVKDFWEFAWERQAVWYRRNVLRQARPWTDDPVMRARFFTNCFRELDPGTAVAIEIARRGAGRPVWEQLWNLVLYRRFNREETWAALTGGEGYVPVADASDDAGLVNELEGRVNARRAVGKAVFTDAHQVFPLNDVRGKNLVERVFTCAYEAVLQFPGLADRLQAARFVQEAYRLMRVGAGPGISSFLGWQLTLDSTYGDRPIVSALVDWAPVNRGARVGLVLHMSWPRLGTVDVGISRNRFGKVRDLEVQGFPALDAPPPKRLEAVLLRMVTEQDREFGKRGLDFSSVAAPGHPRMTPASVEHTLCEWMKYASIATGLPHTKRIYDHKLERRGSLGEGAVRGRKAFLPVDESLLRGDDNRQGRVEQAHNDGSGDQARTSRPEAVVEIEPSWSELPGPTALARQLIARGAGDDKVMAATGAAFGGRTEGPRLFTRCDLARLRARILKKDEESKEDGP